MRPALLIALALLGCAQEPVAARIERRVPGGEA
jgi:hypothetical protein